MGTNFPVLHKSRYSVSRTITKHNRVSNCQKTGRLRAIRAVNSLGRFSKATDGKYVWLMENIDSELPACTYYTGSSGRYR